MKLDRKVILRIICFRYGISVFVIPLIVLIVTYSCICREIWHSSVGELEFRSRQPPKINRVKRTPLISRAKINTVKQTIAVIVIYIVCSTPFICAQLWATWDPQNPFLEGKYLLQCIHVCGWLYMRKGDMCVQIFESAFY